MPHTFSAIRTTTEKASLNSNRAMSLIVRLALPRAIGRALVGASGKSIGSTPASAQADRGLETWKMATKVNTYTESLLRVSNRVVQL